MVRNQLKTQAKHPSLIDIKRKNNQSQNSDYDRQEMKSNLEILNTLEKST